MNGGHYLTICNQADDSTSRVNSWVLKFNGNTFQQFQSFPTCAAQDFTFFTLNNNSYLAFASAHCDGAFGNLYTTIYKFNGTTFLPFQNISTYASIGLKFFTMNNVGYLAIANNNDDAINLKPQIFQFNGTMFRLFQNTSGPGGVKWEFFTTNNNNNNYLMLSVFGPSPTFNANSPIYKFNNATTAFEVYQTIPTSGGNGANFFAVNGVNYLGVSNFYNATSVQKLSSCYF